MFSEGIGDQRSVNILRNGSQSHPAISADADGSDIVVAWEQIPEHGVGIWARKFVDGVGFSSIIQVNGTQRGAQKGPALAHLADGGFVASWYGKGDGDHWGTFARTFNELGNATSDEILVNQTVRAGQIRPAVAAANSGYIVTWQGRGEGDHVGIFARFEDTEVMGPFAIAPIPNQTIDEGMTLSVTPQIIDLDGEPDDITFSLLAGAPDATIDPVTGTITWVTTELDGPSVTEFIVEARDGEFADNQSFDVTVLEVNDPPTIIDFNEPGSGAGGRVL